MKQLKFALYCYIHWSAEKSVTIIDMANSIDPNNSNPR